MKSRFRSSLHAAVAVSALAASAPALAQEADATAPTGGVEEIVITAQTRAISRAIACRAHRSSRFPPSRR